MRYEDISDEVLAKILVAVEGSSADALWSYIRENLPGVSSKKYEERKHYFLSVLYRLMKEGRIKLAAEGKFLEGTIEEQVQRYSDLWPKDESILDKFDFQLIFNEEGGFLYYWVEGGFVWVYEDGFMEWT